MASSCVKQQTNVHVTISEDEGDSLQELFNPASQKQQIPLFMRNLPKSFFNPPSNAAGAGDKCVSNELVICHSKANSSPASLDATYLTRYQTQLFPTGHSRQKSLDTDAAYDMDVFPTLKLQQNQENSESNERIMASSRQVPASFGQRTALRFQVCDLPAGYEMAINKDNQVYFLNHKNQDTSWFDPRIPRELQKWGMSPEQLEVLHITYAEMQLGGRISDRGDISGRLSLSPVANMPQHALQQQNVHLRSVSAVVSMTTGTGTPSLCSSTSSTSSSSTMSAPPPPQPPCLPPLSSVVAAAVHSHSHQGSIDSGMGQSVAGGRSSNPTPEHHPMQVTATGTTGPFIQYYDTGVTNCEALGGGVEMVGGINYPFPDLSYVDLNLLDPIGIRELERLT